MNNKGLICSLAIGVMALKFVDVQAMPVSAELLTSHSLLAQQSGAEMISFDAPGAGSVFVTLNDLGFPAPFATLEYGLSDSAGLNTMNQAGVETTVTLTGATTINADIFATLGAGASGGLYNLTATFLPAGSTTVPLPTTGLSMLGGCLMLLRGARRQRSSARQKDV